MFFSVPAKMCDSFMLTQGIAKKMPFNVNSGLFSLRGDMYDSFMAPIEYRFSEPKANELLFKSWFERINITRLRNSPGLVVWGSKP